MQENGGLKLDFPIYTSLLFTKDKYAEQFFLVHSFPGVRSHHLPVSFVY